MAGIRTAAVWTIGAATLSTAVGQTSLGNYIFSGLQTENWIFVLFGCAAAAALALVVDQLLGLIEAGVASAIAGASGLGRIGVAAAPAIALVPLIGGPRPTWSGAKNFSEQFILAELMAERLEAQGATARAQGGARLGHRLPRARRRRDRRLCRLFRHAVDQRAGAPATCRRARTCCAS